MPTSTNHTTEPGRGRRARRLERERDYRERWAAAPPQGEAQVNEQDTRAAAGRLWRRLKRQAAALSVRSVSYTDEQPLVEMLAAALTLTADTARAEAEKQRDGALDSAHAASTAFDRLYVELGAERRRSGELRQTVKDCEPYLKDGETPAACITRNRNDIDALMSMLAKEKATADTARAQERQADIDLLRQLLAALQTNHGGTLTGGVGLAIDTLQGNSHGWLELEPET